MTELIGLLYQIRRKSYTGGDTLEALDKRLAELISAAADRAKANDRKTLMAKDV